MATKVYVGDVGTLILLDTGFNIADALSLAIKVKKPDGDLISWGAVLSGTTKVLYTVLTGDLDAPGTWQLQPEVETPAGKWLGETVKMRVYDPFR